MKREVAKENSASDMSKNCFGTAVLANTFDERAEGNPNASDVNPSCLRKSLRWFIADGLTIGRYAKCSSYTIGVGAEVNVTER